MSVRQVIVARLLAYTDLTDLVSTRVYPVMRHQIPTGADGLPCVTVRKVSNGFEESFTDVFLEHPVYRVTAWGDTPTEAEDVAAEVRAALTKWSSAVTTPVILDVRPIPTGDEDYDGDDAFWEDQDFEVWHR